MSAQPHTKLFTQVDHTKDPDFFVRFMDEAQKPAGIQASKRLMLERMALAPGQAVFEVGCGPGTDVFDLAEIVGPAGRLVGLDASDAEGGMGFSHHAHTLVTGGYPFSRPRLTATVAATVTATRAAKPSAVRIPTSIPVDAFGGRHDR